MFLIPTDKHKKYILMGILTGLVLSSLVIFGSHYYVYGTIL